MNNALLIVTTVLFAMVSAANVPIHPQGFKPVNQTPAFTENKGQVTDNNGLSRPEIKYYLDKGNLKICLTNEGIIYQFASVHYPQGYLELLTQEGKVKQERLQELEQKIQTETYRMDMVLLGANQSARINSEGKSSYLANYYGNNVMDVHDFDKITYKDIYPGIDWVIYASGDEIKYDFILKPGADPALIKLQFKEQEEISLDKDGSFTLKNRLGTVTEKGPVSFQKDKEVQTQFLLEGNIISFKLGKYNTNETLTIDPALSWATYYGDASYNGGSVCTADAAGNVYMAGRTSPSNIANGGYQNTYGGGVYDAFLVKFNNLGARQWATYYGGTGKDEGYCCATDAFGNVYLTGGTQSVPSMPFGGHQSVFGGGGGDAFLVKFNGNGNLIWATYYGGTGGEHGRNCMTDPSGNVYMTGYTSSTTGISSAGYQNTLNGIADGFLVKFNSSGGRMWATYFGGPGDDDLAYACAINALGEVYLVGSTDSNSGIASGGYQGNYGGGNYDAFIAKFAAGGALQWASYYGDVADEIAYSCGLDAAGNLFFTGYTTSLANIASGGFQNTYGGGSSDGFLAKFDPAGNRVWASYYGDTGDDDIRYCAVGPTGNLFVTGATSSTVGIAFGGFQNTIGGGLDTYIVEFNNSGLRQWASYYGGLGGEYVAGCASDNSGNVYFSGETVSVSNIAFNGFQNTFAGGNGDAFLAKFCGNLQQVSTLNGNILVCPGSTQIYSFNGDPNATGYQWSLPVGWSGTSSTNSISAVPGTSGVFTVTISDASCSTVVQTLSVTVNSCASIDQQVDPGVLFVAYPNPTAGKLTIETSQDCQVSVLNTMGQLIMTARLAKGQNNIDLSNYPHGIYLIKARQNDSSKTLKFIME